MDQPPGTGRSAIEPVVKVMEEVLDLLRYFEPTLAVRRAAKGADVAPRVDSSQADLWKRRGGYGVTGGEDDVLHLAGLFE